MTEFIILPGIGGSSGDHWQTIWQAATPGMRRIEPKSWDIPDPIDWIGSLERAVAACALPPILIAHSLSCLLVPLWARESMRAVRGAFLVGVPDPASPAYPVEAEGFVAVPERLPFPSIVLVSTDDPYGSVHYARSRAEQWGSDLIILGPLGHINGASGIGDWPEGMTILHRFVAESTASAKEGQPCAVGSQAVWAVSHHMVRSFRCDCSSSPDLPQSKLCQIWPDSAVYPWWCERLDLTGAADQTS